MEVLVNIRSLTPSFPHSLIPACHQSNVSGTPMTELSGMLDGSEALGWRIVELH